MVPATLSLTYRHHYRYIQRSGCLHRIDGWSYLDIVDNIIVTIAFDVGLDVVVLVDVLVLSYWRCLCDYHLVADTYCQSGLAEVGQSVEYLDQ